MYKGFIKDVVNARDTTSLYIVEPPGLFRTDDLVHSQQDVPIFVLGYTVLLRSVSASEFLPNSFLSEIRREVVREVLLAAIRSQASYMSTSGFFDFVLECSEVSEHFALLPHQVDPGVPGEVVD